MHNTLRYCHCWTSSQPGRHDNENDNEQAPWNGAACTQCHPIWPSLCRDHHCCTPPRFSGTSGSRVEKSHSRSIPFSSPTVRRAHDGHQARVLNGRMQSPVLPQEREMVHDFLECSAATQTSTPYADPLHCCALFATPPAGVGWAVGRKMQPPSAARQAAALSNAGARAAPLHTASTARGGGAAASSPLRMVTAEPVLKPTRCVCARAYKAKCVLLLSLRSLSRHYAMIVFQQLRSS